MDGKQNLCIKCGLCCDGTIFQYVKLKEQEIINNQFHYQIVKSGETGMLQPCIHLKENICNIYHKNRPANCIAFKCKLLRAFEAGKISYIEALVLIDKLMVLKGQILESISDFYIVEPPVDVKKLMSDFEEYYVNHIGELEFRKMFGKTLLNYAMLIQLIKKHFLVTKQRALP